MNGGSIEFLGHGKPLRFEKFKPLATVQSWKEL